MWRKSLSLGLVLTLLISLSLSNALAQESMANAGSWVLIDPTTFEQIDGGTLEIKANGNAGYMTASAVIKLSMDHSSENTGSVYDSAGIWFGTWAMPIEGYMVIITYTGFRFSFCIKNDPTCGNLDLAL